MIWICKGVFVILVIKLLLTFGGNGLFSRGQLLVSANGNVKISGPSIQIEKPPLSKLVISNLDQPFFLPCQANVAEDFIDPGRIYYYFTWYRNEEVIETTLEGRKYFNIFANGSLRLPLNGRATGSYQCKINANSTAMLSDTIYVEYPVFKRIPCDTDITAEYGTALTLNCPVYSIPPANISWFFGNVPLTDRGENPRYLVLTNGSLVLKDIGYVDEIGKYKCIASNRYVTKKQRQITWTVGVTRPLTMRSKLCNLLPPLQNTTQYIPRGTQFRLICRCSTATMAISWWFQRNVTEKPMKLANHSDEYFISHANIEEHEGLYTCKVSNESQTFEVIVTVAPTILQSLPSYETLISASITFRCNCSGNPLPNISWYHNGFHLNSSFTRYVYDNELVIHSFDPEEGGIYQCFARNHAGEASTAGEVRIKLKDGETIRPNPWQNIRCFPHSFNTVNITFESETTQSLVIIHIVQSNPHRWISPPLMKLNHTSYLVISNDLPVYRPFQMMIRVLYPTSKISSSNRPQQQTMLSSLRSAPITCFTQGLLLHSVNFGNGTFVTWSQPRLSSKKYFIIQFNVNITEPHPSMLHDEDLHGTEESVTLNASDIAKKLIKISTLNESEVQFVLEAIRIENTENETDANYVENAVEDNKIYTVIVSANVTGILLQKFSRITMRVLIITSENEKLRQDFRYVQWKTIENKTVESSTVPFQLKVMESRMLIFGFNANFKESCVYVCLWQIQFPIINKEEQRCDKYNIVRSLVEIRKLKPDERYRINFLSCETQMFYGMVDVQTIPDPPGTISNHRITRHDGLKLSWDPPVHSNGKVHHYNIQWTLNNVTHEVNVMECSICFYKFPNVSESAKINVTVRVVGETGIGAPIYLDLRSISHYKLHVENSVLNPDIYSGILIGLALSVLCIFFFALLTFYQRKKFKIRSPAQLIIPSDLNYNDVSNMNYTTGSTTLLNSNLMQPDCHEMQILITSTNKSVDQNSNPNESYSNRLFNDDKTAIPKPSTSCDRHAPGTTASSHSTSAAIVQELMQSSTQSSLKDTCMFAPRRWQEQISQQTLENIGAHAVLPKYSKSDNGILYRLDDDNDDVDNDDDDDGDGEEIVSSLLTSTSGYVDNVLKFPNAKAMVSSISVSIPNSV